MRQHGMSEHKDSVDRRRCDKLAQGATEPLGTQLGHRDGITKQVGPCRSRF